MSQLVFSGAPDHMTFGSKNEIEYTIGFGNATRFIAREMNRAGISFVQGKHQTGAHHSSVNLSFCYPDEFSFQHNQYKIAYMPWESTGLKHGYAEELNNCDEVWTTSDWSQEVLASQLSVPVYLYEHGIPEFCKPMKRKRNKIFTFLHVGEPAVRKGGQDVVNSFISTFGEDPNYRLIIKSSGKNSTRVYSDSGDTIGVPPSKYKNIQVIEDQLSENDLISLYRSIDAFVYPSYGEGFGFNSAYAIAMGIPTICTAEWATYRDFITLPLDSSYTDSPWPQFHPGQVLKPDLDQMSRFMIDVSENYDKYLTDAWNKSIGMHERFDWSRVSSKPMSRLKKIISMTSK